MSLQSRPANYGIEVTAPDPGDFSEVFRVFAPRVSRWAKRLGGRDIDAEDVTQDVFGVVLRRLKDFDPERAEMGAWLYGITVRVVQGARRRRQVRNFLGKVFGAAGETDEPVSPLPNAETQLASVQARTMLYKLLEGLPETHRTAFLLYEVEELDGPTIAKITGTSVANVWVRVHRARRMLETAAQAVAKDDKP